MVLLSTIAITSLTWGIMVFFILQLIAGIKFISSLYTKIKLLENSLNDNKFGDAKHSENTKSELEKIKDTIKIEMKETNSLLEQYRNILFKEIKKVEEKSDHYDKETMRRVDGIAQGLVKVETKIDNLEKLLSKL